MRKFLALAVAAMMAPLAMAPTIATAQDAWVPDSNVELIVGAEAGGAADRFARIIQEVLQRDKLVPTSMTVLNKVGQGQRVGIAYVNQHEGDGNYLIVVSAGTVTSAIHAGNPPLQDELTPIAKMVNTDIVVSVKKDSPIQTVQDIIDRLKADQTSVSFTFSQSAGNTNHIAIAQLAELAGADPSKLRIVVNNSGSIAATQVAGGHVDVALTSSGSAQPLVDSGDLRLIGAASNARLPSLPDLPTLKEQGYDVVPSTWYLIFGPKGMTEAQTAFWAENLKKALDSQEMQDFVKSSNWTADYVTGPDLVNSLKTEWDNLTASLVAIGMLQK